MRATIRNVLGFLFLSSAVVWAQDAKPSGAKLYVDETHFDFGYIPAQATVSHSVFFYSRGTATLHRWRSAIPHPAAGWRE